ncbi:NAD(P)-binding protein [Echria macrotheca]|uniref:NAD(P)-binding protein n=1 Tax=Echria macrotheca TaxID=438768 RepID=A0AAJ0B7Q9_9PEZI|nr:NAD(P)-binding protein [Echria macrotheca]
MFEQATSIPPGSWVLVTGATGWLATHIIKQFLERGYKVRGTVRDVQKASWLTTDLFKSAQDSGSFQVIAVPDLADLKEGDFDAAVTGVSAVINVASIVSFDPDPNKVITPTVRGLTYLLEAAAKQPSIQKFVHTSSFLAATIVRPGIDTRIERDTWNDAAVNMAWADPTPETAPMRPAMVYMASKVEAEKALWKFVEEKKPHFAVNSISPSTILGQPLVKKHIDVPTAWLRHLYEGNSVPLKRLAALYEIDVKDAASLHVAAVLDPNVKNERIQAWGRHCDWNAILAVTRRLYPEHEFMEDLPGMARLDIQVDCSSALALLEKWAGQETWRTLEETVKDNVDGVIEFGA